MRVYFSGFALPWSSYRADPEDLLSARKPHVMMSYWTLGTRSLKTPPNTVAAKKFSQDVFKRRMSVMLKGLSK